MLVEIIIVILVLGYFIKDQFEFAQVTRLRYLFLPIAGLVVFLTTINHLKDLPLAIILGLIAIAIGKFQTSSFEVRYKYLHTNLVYQADGVDYPITKKELFSKGGANYLYGWLVIAFFQISISMIKHGLNMSDLPSELLAEIFKDLFVIFRITDSESGWWVWELYSISSISYLICLVRSSPLLAQHILKKDPLN